MLRIGFSIEAACKWVGIDRSTFYRHLQSDPDFATLIRMEILMLYLAATEVINNKIMYEKDAKTAMWYLEKTNPERYGKRKICRSCQRLQARYRPQVSYLRARTPKE